MAKQFSGFRLDQQTVTRIEQLAAILRIGKSDVVSHAVARYANFAAGASAKVTATIGMLNERFGPNARRPTRTRST